MINHIKIFFSRIIDRFFGRRMFENKSAKNIDLSNIFSSDFIMMQNPEAIRDDFKSFSTMDDYNKDFLSIFQTYRKDFVLDYSQKDGHFRV
jgi:hypothetical protein